MGYSQKCIIAGQEFSYDSNYPIINFTEGPKYDSSSLTCNLNASTTCGSGGAPAEPAAGITGLNRFRPRQNEFTYAATRAKVKQFVIHLDGCDSAQSCFSVLQNERGLSVHFILDNDGTVYQTLDLAHCGYHANGMNETSIGIEICNRGEAKNNLDFYSKRGQSRNIVTVNIQGDTILSFDFTKAQLESMAALGRFVAKALPNIGLNYPNNAGSPIYNMINPTDVHNVGLRGYSGYLAHYHTNIQKWDPGPFDFHDFMEKVRGSKSFPIGIHNSKNELTTEMPKDADALDAAMRELYDANEQSASAGFFPVGEFDKTRLWHGGVHFFRPPGEKITSPWSGFVMAARNGGPRPGIGSTNFALIRHSFKISDTTLEFYALYMHLQEEGHVAKPIDDGIIRKDKHGNIIPNTPAPVKEPELLPWMNNATFKTMTRGDLVLFDMPGEPVQAGDVLGHFGMAGPDDADQDSQVHFEIFLTSLDALDTLDTEKRWTVIDGSGDGRFCRQKDILEKIERKKKDGLITKDDEQAFFKSTDNADRDAMHWLVTTHVSEWYNGSPDWLAELQAAPEPDISKRKDLADLVEQQITPTIWWTEDTKLNLPPDGIVHTLHPITFVKWLNDKLDSAKIDSSAKVATAADIDAANRSQTKLLDDNGDKAGTSFVDKDEITLKDPRDKRSLDEMLDGYGD